MAGLLQGMPGGEPMPGAKPGPVPQVAQPPQGDDGEVPNVSDEEQAAYDDFVTSGMELIYEGGEVRPGILKLLDEEPSDLIKALGNSEAFENFSPVTALAATAVVVVLQLVRKAGANKPSGEIIMHGGQALLEDLADLSGEAGLHKFTDEEANQALMVALDLYRETAAAEGLLDEDALKEDWQELKQADQEGRFFEKVPQLAGGAQ